MKIEHRCRACPWHRVQTIRGLDDYEPTEAPECCPQCGGEVRTTVVGQGAVK